EARTRQDTADLNLFAECDQIRHDAKMLTAPRLTRSAAAALHFVENQEDIACVADFAQLTQPLAPEMIVAAFALDRFDDDGANVGSAFLNEVTNFRFASVLALDYVALAI